MPHHDILYPVFIDATRKVLSRPVLLQDNLAQLIADRLHLLMTVDRPYLRATYSLKDLGDDLAVPYYIVSCYLNRKLGLRFNDYVNKHRVEYFKELVIRGHLRNTTVDGIAGKCGFRNRNTLAISFKRFTGMTPSEFIRNNS
jgi:YesN/AraC family two-component response regulator